MSQIDTLLTLTTEAHTWTHKLIATVPDEKWLILPPIIESNIYWPIGHFIVTHFYHIITCLKTPEEDVLQLIPIKDYFPLFSAGSKPTTEPYMAVTQLRETLTKVELKLLEKIKSLDEKDLSSDLFPTQFPHPLAKTKLQALSWDMHHTMWHGGQIALIKRVVDKSFVFST
jgi:DinB superfamily